MSTMTPLALPYAGDITYVVEWPGTTYGATARPPGVPIAFAPSGPLPGAVRSRSEKRATRAARATVRFAAWELDLIERRLIGPGGGTERIPGLEFALLKTFIAYARQPLSRPDLARLLARDGNVGLSGRTVDSYVSRLRRRLGRGGSTSPIATVRSVGYRFDADIERSG